MFYYFGYGSNINLNSLRAKGVVPHNSSVAVLKGWKLVFNVKHWFRHEGGVGNIEPSNDPEDYVMGLVHQCEDEHLSLLDAVEAYGVGYDRVEVGLDVAGETVSALAYVGIPSYIDNSCRPTQRYLNIIAKGAIEAGLDEAYIQKLTQQPLYQGQEYSQYVPPFESDLVFDDASLSEHKNYTAVYGAVFDMSEMRNELRCLFDLFGGKDTTLFHLKRLDCSTGDESIEDIKRGDISAAGKKYLNAYLHEYCHEFKYVGRYEYND